MIIGYTSLGGTSTLISGTNGRLLYGTSQQATLTANQEAYRAFIGYGGANNTNLSTFDIGLYDVSGGNFTTAPRLCAFELQINNAVEGGNSTQRWLEFALTPFDLSAHAGKDLAIGFADPAANTGFNIPLVTVTGATRKNHTGANQSLPSTMANSTATSNQAWSMYIETRTKSSLSITSVNSGNGVRANSTGNTAVTNFPAQPLSGNLGGKAISITGFSGGNVTFTMPPYVDTQTYPKPNINQTLTLSDGVNNPTLSVPLNPPVGRTAVNVATPDNVNQKKLGYWLALAGHAPVNGDVLIGVDAQVTWNADTGGVANVALPLVTEVVHWQQSSGITYIHNVTISAEGVVSEVSSFNGEQLNSSVVVGEYLTAEWL